MKRRKSLISTLVILAAALTGLALMNIGQGSAVDESALAAMNMAGADTTLAAVSPAAFNSTALPAIGKMVGALVIVIICIYLAVFLLRRVMGGRYRGKGSTTLLEILESTYVAPKKTISLVRVAEKAVLIGITENNMTVLTELDADQTAVALSGEETVTETDDQQFDQLFERAACRLRRFVPKKPEMVQEN